MTSLDDIFELIVVIIALVGFLITVIEIKKSGLTFEEPITHGKNKFDVALREFARQVVRALLITLRVVERK